MSDEFFHVALLIETSREYGRGLLRGVARYQAEHGPWSIFFEPHGLTAPPPAWLPTWKGHGILARVNDRRMADMVLETGLPAVDVRGALSDVSLPFIGVDNRPVSELAFSHLRDCGLTQFGFCGTPRGENPNQDFRCDHFVKQAVEAGFDCDVWLGARRGRSRRVSWEAEQQSISNWLTQLPKPVGIMTCHDDRGLQVLDACRRAGLHAPDEVAVVSVDNDTHLCNLSTPPLTSIDVNPGRIGYEAAALLHRAMKGEKVSNQPIHLGPPRGIVVRRSTETSCVEDVDVAAAVRLIRDRALTGLRVQEIIAATDHSPSTLERRFKKTFGRTLKEEINRVRLNRAKLLLAETDLAISVVAERSGFSESKYFCEVFRRREGSTATQYRAKFRLDN